MFPIASEHSVSVTSSSQSNFSLSFKIDIEKELEQMYSQKAKGAQIRSREK
jgi:hypothetical protein